MQVLPVSVDDPRTSSLGSNNSETSQMLKLTKVQIKALQEAMYHSAENGHLGKDGDLRYTRCSLIWFWSCLLVA